jgi:predicted metal-dependent hydrolase
MKPEQYSAEYGCFSFNYTVVRRERKTLEIAVEPDSTIRVAAPKLASPERIAQKVKKRASWILQLSLWRNASIPGSAVSAEGNQGCKRFR